MSTFDGSSLSRREVLKSGALVGAAFTLGHPVWSEAANELPLITKAIPSTGERLPVIGLGTNNYSVTDPADIAERRAVLKRMPQLGGTIIDTAQAYGRSEEVIGELLEELGNRDAFFLATKPPLAGDVSNAAEVLEGAFRRLQTDRIDLMQIHNLHGVQELLPVMREMKQAGRIRYIGITTFQSRQYEPLLQFMRQHTFDFIQVNYSIGDREAEEKVLPLARDQGTAVLVNVPLGGRRGENLLSQAKGLQLPKWAAEIDVTSWAQFLLKYVVSHPAVTAAIPGTTKVSHLEDNQRAARGRLPDNDMRRRMEEFWAANVKA